MAVTLFERGVAEEKKQPTLTSILAGTVVNDCDLVMQGKVLVRIPSLDLEVPARLTGPGGGSGAGLFYSPRKGDEVLIALSQNDPVDAYVIGGLWGTSDPPPVKTPIDPQTKRVLKTGLKRGLGHEVEFDDLLHTITITSSTGQSIVIDPGKIEIRVGKGPLVQSITLDLKQQKISISGGNIEIAALGNLTLSGANVSIDSKTAVSINAGAVCTIRGATVKIN